MKISREADFDRQNVFGKGDPNAAYAQYFVGNSFLNPLTQPGQCPIFLANVTFEPGCRNNWHIHHAVSSFLPPAGSRGRGIEVCGRASASGR